MIKYIIRYFFMYISIFYSIEKIDKTKKKLKPLNTLIISIIFAIICSYVYKNIKYSDSIFIIATIILYAIILLKSDLINCFIVVVISYGISYMCLLIVTFLVSAFFLIALDIKDYMLIMQLICGSIQFMLLTLLFRIKRFNAGIVFLNNHSYSFGGLIVSIFITILSAILSTSKGNAPVNFAIFITPLCFYIFLYWWRTYTTRTYTDRMYQRNINQKAITIQNMDIRIRQLENEIKQLSSMVHKDNKLIPAMELAVRELLLEDASKHEDLNIKANELLQQLTKISSERIGILNSISSENTYIEETGYISVDSVIKYINQKAVNNGIRFEFIYKGNLDKHVDKVISESDLEKIIADLTENALIADINQVSDNKNILLCIEANDILKLYIYDSAKPFDVNVLTNFGHQKYTTHADSGGSGIGLFDTYNLLVKYSASLKIEEYELTDSTFTKCITVSFDYENNFSLISSRNKKERRLIKKSIFTYK